MLHMSAYTLPSAILVQKYEEKIQMIRNKAGNENQKVGEIAFLTNLR